MGKNFIHDRLQRLRNFIKQESLSAVLITDRYNVTYFSGFTGDTAQLYISLKQQVLITDFRYYIWAKEEAGLFHIVQVGENHSYTQIVKELFQEENGQSLGFENRKMLYCQVLDYQNAIKPCNWVPLDQKLDKLRMIKDQEELSYIAKAEKIGDRAFSKVLPKISVGMTERELAWELECAMKKEGAQGLSFETIAVSGVKTAMPHAVPGDKKIQPGEFVLMDFGCIYNGYCSDMTRTVVMGTASKEQRKIYQIVLEAQKKALGTIRAGIQGKQADKVAREYIEERGYGSCFGHALGHSLGLYIHEEPRLSKSEETILEEGMLETVEPGIYIPDFGGVRIEDLVIVEKDGCKNLTGSPKELIECSLQ